MNMLFIILVVLFAIGLGVYLARDKGCSAEGSTKDNTGASSCDGGSECDCSKCKESEQSAQKNANKRQILEALERSESGGGAEAQITNDEVQALLGVSDATATRYLGELEAEGKLRQVGTVGKSVHYVKS